MTDPSGDGADHLAVALTGTGRGLSPGPRERLFEEVVRLDPSAGPGVGTGLTISQLVADARYPHRGGQRGRAGYGLHPLAPTLH